MSAYKQYRRKNRNMMVEEVFTLGMNYTNTPMPEGFSRAMVNYDIKDNGQILVPRRGYHTLHSQPLSTSEYNKRVHHTGMGYLHDEVTKSDSTIRYILFQPEKGTSSEWIPFHECEVLIEQSFNASFGTEDGKSFIRITPEPGDGTYYIRNARRNKPSLMHNINTSDPRIMTGSSYQPTYTFLNGKVFLPGGILQEDGTYDEGFARITFTKNEYNAIECKYEPVVPKDLTPVEAFNYGYNMFHKTPYAFEDIQSPAVAKDYIILEGIIPYSDPECTQIRFNAKVGEKITFRAIATFPEIEGSEPYAFRWEIREIGTEQVTVIEDQKTTTRRFNYGDKITHTFLPPYRQFSITVMAYSTKDLSEPLQAMVLASYTLAADNSRTTTNVEALTYPLQRARGFTTWNQRVVLWDVPGADNMLFVSDINDPSCFPYPHNMELFEDKVVSCISHLGDLLVFTTSKLIKLTWAEDGLSWTVEVVQDRLLMTPFDRETIIPVQNMVFFKNGTYYYMIVPRSNQGISELMLAPISTPITNLLDTFEESVEEMMSRLYNYEYGDAFPKLKIKHKRKLVIHDYYTYLDNSQVRCVYKYKLADVSDETGEQTTLLYMDFILNYDTMERTWTSYALQSTGYRFVPYLQNVTDTTVFVYTYNQAIEEDVRSSAQFIKMNQLSAVDQFEVEWDTQIGHRVIENYQYLDTGYRDHDTQVKKRYREIQFKINNLEQATLQFGTEFLIDDSIRKPMYNYRTELVDDPSSPDFGYFYIEKVYDDTIVVGGAAVLEETEPEHWYVPEVESELTTPSDSLMLHSKRWVLDASQLAKISVIKVRFKVSGKGYSPRLILVSFNNDRYELMNHNWVYRQMNAR